MASNGRSGLESRYPKIPLKHVASVNDETLEEDTDPEAEIAYIDIGNVDSSGEIKDVTTLRLGDAPSRARRIVRDGDVIISTVRTYLQAIAPIEEPPDNLIVSTGFAVVRPIPELLDAGFCKYALREPNFISEVVKRSVGANYPAINASELAAIPICIPPFAHQRTIANYLDQQTARLDDLISAKQQLLALLAEKRQALITHAVTRGLDPAAPLRDSGVPWLGEIPADWEMTILKRLLDSMDYGISESVGISGNVAILRMGDILNGTISYDKIGFIDEVSPELLLKPGDLLFNRTNSLDQVGKVGLFEVDPGFPVSFASYLVRMRCGGTVLPEYLNYLLNSRYVVAWARSEALPSIGQANLNPNRYSYLPVPLPPIQEQFDVIRWLGDSLNLVSDLQNATTQTIELLKERRLALIAAAVTGEIEVT